MITKKTLEDMEKRMTDDLNKAWNHISLSKHISNREYWFMTEWHASIEKVFGDAK